MKTVQIAFKAAALAGLALALAVTAWAQSTPSTSPIEYALRKHPHSPTGSREPRPSQRTLPPPSPPQPTLPHPIRRTSLLPEPLQWEAISRLPPSIQTK